LRLLRSVKLKHEYLLNKNVSFIVSKLRKMIFVFGTKYSHTNK
jgi:hypothetical protein